MRYILYPRYITDTKGNQHFVTAHELLDLHGVDDSVKVSDCKIVKDYDDFTLAPDDVWLSVQLDGHPMKICKESD